MIEWGSVPDWLEAVSTTAAFIATLILLRHSVLERREAREQDQRRQARLVSQWLAPRRVVVDVGGGKTANPSRTSLAVRNASDEPIYQVSVVQHSGFRGGRPAGWWEVIPPRTTVLTEWDPDNEAAEEEPLPLLEFVDAGGLWWQRDHRGVLSRAEPEPRRRP